MSAKVLVSDIISTVPGVDFDREANYYSCNCQLENFWYLNNTKMFWVLTWKPLQMGTLIKKCNYRCVSKDLTEDIEVFYNVFSSSVEMWPLEILENLNSFLMTIIHLSVLAWGGLICQDFTYWSDNKKWTCALGKPNSEESRPWDIPHSFTFAWICPAVLLPNNWRGSLHQVWAREGKKQAE